MKKYLIILIVLGIVLLIFGVYLSPILPILGFILSVYGTIKSYLDRKEQKNRDLKILSGQTQMIKIQKETKEAVSHVQETLSREFTK